MHISTLIDSLPNGFHDAKLYSMSINYKTRKISFLLHLWTGNLHSKSTKTRERYSPAKLELRKFDYCIIDSPDDNYPYSDSIPLCIDIYTTAPNDSVKTPPADSKSFKIYIWVNEWNAYIRIAAQDAILQFKKRKRNAK